MRASMVLSEQNVMASFLCATSGRRVRHTAEACKQCPAIGLLQLQGMKVVTVLMIVSIRVLVLFEDYYPSIRV